MEKDESERRRAGLSPAAMSKAAAESEPTPKRLRKTGALSEVS